MIASTSHNETAAAAQRAQALSAAQGAKASTRDGAAKDGAKEGMSFWDFVDIINPLQHIPVVNGIYRAVTGDTINEEARIAGSVLYGGPVGYALEKADMSLEKSSGHTAGGHIASLFGADDTELPAKVPVVEVAEAGPMPAEAAVLPAAQPAAQPAATAAAVPSGAGQPAPAPPAALPAVPAGGPIAIDQDLDALLMAKFGARPPKPTAAAPADPARVADAAPARPGGGMTLDRYRQMAVPSMNRAPHPNTLSHMTAIQRGVAALPSRPAETGTAQDRDPAGQPAASQPAAAPAEPAPAATTPQVPVAADPQAAAQGPAPVPKDRIPEAMMAAMEKYQAQMRARNARSVTAPTVDEKL